MKLYYALVLLFVPVLFDVACGRSFKRSSKEDIWRSCSYESCHATDNGKLNVHLIPHSHDDVGWLKTVDEYFYGANNTIQRAGVQSIIGSVVEALQDNSDRKFIQVETAFFWQWWKKQSEETRNIVKKLVNDGQLEIINAAWSMNDEAAAHYQSIIDQFTWGLRIIDDTLGECGRPNIGWQIDPFGHSSEMASIFSQLGYEAVFFARLDYRDKDRRMNDSALELIWQGSKSLGSSTNIFTHVFSSFYTQPEYFCWDVLCSDEPLVDDEESPDYNIERKVQDFADYVEKHAEYFQTNNLLVNMGGDFTYQAALMYYVNIDKLIDGFKKFRPDINVIYSTPSCYLKAVNEAANRENVTFELKTDDFFPYTSNKHSPWTGYYTSRPNSKRLERSANNILQTMKQLLSFEILKGKDFSSDITLLKEALGIMQHHDAITGTEKQHVAQDYARIVTKAIHTAQRNIKTVVSDLLRKETNSTTELDVKLCLLANVTHCEASNSEKFIAVVYNPLSAVISDYIRLPTNYTAFKITGPKGNVAYQVTSVIASFSYVHEISPSSYELVFKAEDIPAFGIKLYYVEASNEDQNKLEEIATELEETDDTVYVGTSVAGFEINQETGLLKSVTLNGITLNITQEFLYYNGMNGTNIDNDHTASGAYIFRPTEEDAEQLTDKVTYNIIEGNIVDEVHQTFNSWITQIIRVYKNESYVEFDWLVGPIEILNDLGTEIISRFTTDLKTEATFYTDSNGRELLKRVRNYRETYNYTNDEPVSGNYYPVTARIVIKDEEKDISLAIINDRAQGGSSIKDGAVELMVHRRLLNDDALGVDEALNEYEFDQPVVARGQFLLTFGKSSQSAEIQKNLVHRKLVAPPVFVGETTDDLKQLQENVNVQFAGLLEELPENVKILTLEPWKENILLLRLEHIFESNEHPTYSQKTSVNLTNLFALFDITEIKETTLGANQLLSDAPEKLEWKTSTSDKSSVKKTSNLLDVDNLNIELNPMEIRTFLITYTAINDDEGGEGGNNDGDGGGNDGEDEEESNNSSKNTAVLFFVLTAALINYFC